MAMRELSNPELAPLNTMRKTLANSNFFNSSAIDGIFKRRGIIEAWRVDGDEWELLLADLVGAGVHVGADGKHLLDI